LTNFKVGRIYVRESDGIHFKKDANGVFYKVDEGKWIKSLELTLGDEFKETQIDPGISTYEDMYDRYINGDAYSQDKYFKLLLQRLMTDVQELQKKVK